VIVLGEELLDYGHESMASGRIHGFEGNWTWSVAMA
jgi:hypothetical protein